jgi:hypothetical protein
MVVEKRRGKPLGRAPLAVVTGALGSTTAIATAAAAAEEEEEEEGEEE